MCDVRFRRDVVEFVIGTADGTTWPCGCRAIETTEWEYRLVPCEEHRAEFDEAP